MKNPEDKLLKLTPVLGSKQVIRVMIEADVRRAVNVLKSTLRWKNGDDERIRAAFWQLARRHEKNEKFMLGHFAVLLGINWGKMQSLKRRLCKDKGLEEPRYHELLFGKSRQNGEWLVSKKGLSKEELDGDCKMAAIFVPCNDVQTGCDAILFANGIDALPYDQYLADGWADDGQFDTQKAFAERVNATHGFQVFTHIEFDAIWVKEVMNATVNPKIRQFFLNEGWARYGKRYLVGKTAVVPNVSCYCGRPYADGYNGSNSAARGGVAFVDKLEL